MNDSWILLATTWCIAAAGGVTTETGVLPLADGTELAHTLIRPADAPGPLPVVLVRTPYGRPAVVMAAKAFAEQGMAVLVQDTRGRGDSTGTFVPFVNEAADGDATFDWVLEQPWCNGKVITYGMSYLGITQWQLAPHAKDRLSGMVVQFASADLYRDVVHFGGVQGLAISLSWASMMEGHGMNVRFDHLPLIEADDASGGPIPAWDDWCRHPLLDSYWTALDYSSRYADVQAPALLEAGWYDLFLPGQVDDYMQLARRTGAPERAFVRLVVGPWDHGGTGPAAGRPDLGPEAYVAPVDEERQFLERFAVGRENGFEKKAGVRAFFLGENRWHELAGWPPPAATQVAFHLRSRGGAGRKAGDERPGDGLLLREKPASREEPADAFTYDPKNPCPSYAANLWTPLATLRDQAEMAARTDVLCYATPPLAEEVRIAGPIELELWITSDAPDTDFAGKLVDIAPDETPGRSIDWRGEGIQRARLRESLYTEKLLEPGVPAKVTVHMGHVACLFRKGHRIGLQVTSSNFPRFTRNLNTAEYSNVAKQPNVAHQQVLHDPGHPSALRLWVLALPGDAAGTGGGDADK